MTLLLLLAQPWLVNVHIDADKPGVELRRAPEDALICTAPCDKPVPFDARLQFVLKGENVTPSDAFTFASPGPVKLSVHAGDELRWNAGRMALVTGILGLLAGSLVETTAWADDEAYKETRALEGVGCLLGSLAGRKCPPPTPPPDTRAAHTFACVSVGVGALSTLIGYLVKQSAETSWSSDRQLLDGGLHLRAAQPAQQPGDAALQEAHQPDVEKAPLEQQEEGQ